MTVVSLNVWSTSSCALLLKAWLLMEDLVFNLLLVCVLSV